MIFLLDSQRSVAETVATSLDSRLALVQALTELIGRADAPRLPQLRARLAAALRALSSAEVDTERSLVRLALSRLGPRERDLWKRLAPGLADDLAYEIAERPEASLAALRERLGDALRPAQPSDPLAWLAERLEDAGLDAKSIHDIKGALIGGVLSDSPDAVALSAIWVFFSTEGTSLAAATLAGLERDRLYDGSAMEASA